MPHIHTQPGQHDHTTTAYIIRLDGDEPRVMLHMHRKLHKLLPVGGHIELNETPWQAIAHELTEESGYQLSELQILQPAQRITTLANVMLHPQPIVTNTHDITAEHFHSDVAYAFIANGEPKGQPDDGESMDLRWLSRKDLGALTKEEVWHNTVQTCYFIMDTVLQEWERVPTKDFSLASATEFYSKTVK